jgi:rhodanese-related sulfurtransferase
MQRIILVVVALAMLVMVPMRGSAQWATPPDNAARISQQDFKKLIAAKNVIILDTRNEDVYKLGHIPGAVLLPLEGLESFDEPQYTPLIDSLKTAKKPIVAYCA